MPYALRVVGHKSARRRLIDWGAAFRAYAACDSKAEPERESFLTAFQFGRDFRRYFEEHGSERDYSGPCGASWLWWDIDRPNDLDAALNGARGLCAAMLDRYRDLDEDDVLIFLSGNKGVHVGLPAVWRPEPSTTFNEVAKHFCLTLATRAGVVVDAAIYSKTRLFRAPNSRHPTTGLHKRRLAFDELMHLKPDAVVERARHPEPFDIPSRPTRFQRAADDWAAARLAVEQRSVERAVRRIDGTHLLNAATLDFIREGAPDGERAIRVFRAAANLGEFGCPDDLAHALLTEAALDSGLTPSETKRQIDKGLEHARRQAAGGNE
jgi:hypothetical protein